MTPDREKMIRAVWSEARHVEWPNGSPSLRMLEPVKRPTILTYEDKGPIAPEPIKVLEFVRHQGVSEDREVRRRWVECEGVVVAEHYEPVRR